MTWLEGRGCPVEIDELEGLGPAGFLFILSCPGAPFDLVHLSIAEKIGIALVTWCQVDIYNGGRDDKMLGKHQDDILKLYLPAI